jgi:hypothetical protein
MDWFEEMEAGVAKDWGVGKALTLNKSAGLT